MTNETKTQSEVIKSGQIETQVDPIYETFYVFKPIALNEAWDAIIGDSLINNISNSSFIIKVFAKNKRDAISRGRDLYERIHKLDRDKENIKYFAGCVLSGNMNNPPEVTAENSLAFAVAMNDKFKEHFRKIEQEEGINKIIVNLEKNDGQTS